MKEGEGNGVGETCFNLVHSIPPCVDGLPRTPLDTVEQIQEMGRAATSQKQPCIHVLLK